MSAIAAVTAPPSRALAPAGGDPPAQSALAPNAGSGSGNADQPAVIVSLSSDATAASQAPKDLGSLDPNAVEDALSWAAGANGFADLAAHFDYAGDVARWGKAIADRNEADVRGGAADSALNALSHASSLGIPIQDSVSPYAVENGAAPGTISVGAFSFTSAGSTYSVTPGKDGTLVGTKDGQAWETWQLTTTQSNAAPADTGAAAALQTLTALTDRTAAEHDTPTGLDISA